MDKSSQNFRVQKWVTILSVALFILKIAAYYITGSLAILSDALESIVNVIAGFIGLYSLYVASKPKDTEHPYGHGKAEFISAAAEGSLVIAAGIIILYETVFNILEKSAPKALDQGMWLVAITAVINYLVGYICIRIGKKNNSLALESSGKHLQIDTYSTVGVVAAVWIMLLTKIYWIDTVVAIVLSGFIMYTGYKILRKSLAGIMDEADTEILKKLIDVLNGHRKENWVDLHNLRVIKYGSMLHVDCHLTVPWFLNIHEAHQEIDAILTIIKEEFENRIELFVHTDGCVDFSCAICTKKDCAERKYVFQQRLDWTLENTLSDRKHRVGV